MENKLKFHKVIESSDGITKKYLFKVDDSIVSVIYVNTDDKDIICIPTSIGCNVGCNICYAGKNIPFKRRLSYLEMSYFIDYIVITEDLRFNSKCLLISAMGTGEPLYNIINVLQTFKMYTKTTDNLKFAISTTVPSLELLEDLYLMLSLLDIKVKLQISLHSPYDSIRKNILSNNLPDIKLVINKLLELNKTGNLDIEYNYVLIYEMNDQLINIDKLLLLLPTKSVIKLNKFNNITPCCYKSSSKESIEDFKTNLQEVGFIVEIYETDGVDINGACGQTDII